MPLATDNLSQTYTRKMIWDSQHDREMKPMNMGIRIGQPDTYPPQTTQPFTQNKIGKLIKLSMLLEYAKGNLPSKKGIPA